MSNDKVEVLVGQLGGLGLLRDACAFTTGKPSTMSLDSIYRCEHSPIRTQMFWVEMYNIPTFVSVHLVRHKVGVEHYVKSNREDRPGYSGDAGRNQPVNHAMLINAQSLIHMARKRLCHKAHLETRRVMWKIKKAIKLVDPDLFNYMVPECVYRGYNCHELQRCKHWNQMCNVPLTLK